MNSADIKLDIDRPEGKSMEAIVKLSEELASRMVFLTLFTPFEFRQIRVYETARGFHIYLWSEGEKPKPIEAVIVQLALDSDYRREMFNYLRVWSRKPPEHWNVLWKSKYDKEGNVVSREKRSKNARIIEELVWRNYEMKCKEDILKTEEEVE